MRQFRDLGARMSYDRFRNPSERYLCICIPTELVNMCMFIKLYDQFDLQSTFTQEGDKLIHNQVGMKEGEENSTITREVEGEMLVIVS